MSLSNLNLQHMCSVNGAPPDWSLEHLPFTPAHCRARLQWCLARSGWNHADRTYLSDVSHFQLCPDDHPRRVWRRPRQCADPAFTIARHTDSHRHVTQELWSKVQFLLTAGPLWSLLESHLQHSGASTTI
ncbi:uncharacterized protein TNCV_1037691 [Trichonephila clavipes]|nr:uncharacterized protein TNCV_1037691 [Trichonephila clavipes]